MYLEFFGFKEEPFNITPNTRFLYQSRRHREALAALLYGIEHRKGFIALTGEIGCGKTTVCRELLRRLDRNTTRIALILNPQLSDLELLQAINGEFGIANSSTSKRELLDALNAFLLEENGRGHNCALLIDESQRLSPDALEQVRLISNLETESAKLIQIVLVGQPELDDLLHLPELEQLNQRVTVRHHIDPLDFEEVSEYVAHRLDVAAPSHPVRFHKKALRRVFEFSRGVPRRVNVACDRCLLVAFTQGKVEIDDAIAEQAIREVTSQRRRKKAPSRNDGSDDGAEAATSTPSSPARQGSGGARLLWVAVIAAVVAIVSLDRLRDRTPAVPPPQPAAPAATPAATPGAVAALASPSPTPEPTAAAPTATASPTAAPTVAPTATAVPPTETPLPTAAPTAPLAAPTPAVLDDGTTGVISLVAPATPVPVRPASPTPATVFFDSAAEVPPWTYDIAGIMRHPKAEFSYPAAVLTWLARAEDMRFPETELATLQGLDERTAQAFSIAPGKAPFFLQTVDLPPSLSALPRGWLPALAQLDRRAPGFGPWCVIVDLDDERVRLLDPRAGIVRADRATVEHHLAGVVVPFRDVEGIVGLKPLDRGEGVAALQRRLARGGWFRGAETGLFDPETERAVAAARAALGVPGGPVIDAALAAHLLKPLDGGRR